MENYYKILEVDKNASEEIIEKAYRTLAKRYHPDLQNEINKTEAEEKIKKINEAYSILSDKIKKENYDKQFNENYISTEQYNLIINENIKLKQELDYFKNYYNINNKKNYINYNISNLKNNTNSYNNFNKNYTNNKKNIFNFKKILQLILSLLLTSIILFIFLKLPFIHNLFNSLFDSNGFLLIIIIIFILFYISKK